MCGRAAATLPARHFLRRLSKGMHNDRSEFPISRISNGFRIFRFTV
jgi:hypothetical protein